MNANFCARFSHKLNFNFFKQPFFSRLERKSGSFYTEISGNIAKFKNGSGDKQYSVHQVYYRISSRFLEWMQWIFEENGLPTAGPTVTRAHTGIGTQCIGVLFTIILQALLIMNSLVFFVHCERVSYSILISYPHQNFVLTCADDTSQLIMCHSGNHNNYQGCSKKWKIKISVILTYKNAYLFTPIANAYNTFFVQTLASPSAEDMS